MIYHFKTFKAIAIDVFNALRKSIATAANLDRTTGRRLSSSPAARLLILIAEHFNAIKHIVTEVVNWVIHELWRMHKTSKAMPVNAAD